TTGPGTAWRPRTSSAVTASTAVAPAPPASSGTSSAAAPVSATRPHRAVPGPVSPAAQERMTEGMSDLASSESMLPEKSTSSGSSANCMTNTPGSAARKAEETLGDDVLLDLVGAGVDGAGEGEQVTVHPLLTGELARGAQDVQCGLVGRDVP